MPDPSTRPSSAPRHIPKRAWRWLNRPGRFHVRKPAWFWPWRAWRLGHKVSPVATRVHMYDDVNTSLIPKDAVAVAGYIGGQWPTYPIVQKDWPKAKHLSIAVSSIYNADCLDVEPGDASIAQAADWVKKQLRLRKSGNGYNTTKPVVYTSASWGQQLVNSLTAAGLKYGVDYFWWSAHYDPSKGEHICDPSCGFGLKVKAHATQFTDKAMGKSLDESLVLPGFFA